MDEPDSRSSIEKLLQALLDVSRSEEARAKIDELSVRWRGDAVRVRERASISVENLARELGLVTRRDLDELELRIAQLEHRIGLLESDTSSSDMS